MMKMNRDAAIVWFLRIYLVMVFIFIFAPIATSVVFSFNSDRFPSLPLGSFTWHWYDKVYNDPDVWDAIKTSIGVAHDGDANDGRV